MKLKIIGYDFSVCKVKSLPENTDKEFYFTAKTDNEISIVCKTCDAPESFIKRENNWRAFRIEGVLDFSLIGILADISRILAENKIGIFVISTYNTDYMMTKAENFKNALNCLEKEGYVII